MQATQDVVAAGTGGAPRTHLKPLGGTDTAVLESWGWSSVPDTSHAKIAALAALAQLPEPAPVGSVSYTSRGNLLVIGGDARARAAAAALAPDLAVTLLDSATPAGAGPHAIWHGSLTALEGWLGKFVARIDSLVVADPGPGRTEARAPTNGADADFDLVLDFGEQLRFAMHQPPQGYYAAPRDEAALAAVLEELRGLVGEFEKPKFFHYREDICAHSRSEIIGCNRCVVVCSTMAIRPSGDKVEVDPHLCMGCGACATVCPSGAMSYRYPRPGDRGAQMRLLLSTYLGAGGKDACILIHNGTDGRDLLAAAAHAGAGLPAHVIPIEAWHVAATGPDLLLAAIAYGASQVAVLGAGSEAPQYATALKEQMATAQAVLAALGYSGTHFKWIAARDAAAVSAAFADWPAATGVSRPASFALADDKRTAVEFAVEHLARLAPSPQEEIALPAGAAYGDIVVDREKCTLCLACAGACPESALMDGGDLPMLRFIERNCVQCGLCEKTCPEDAITLRPRLLLTPAVREARVLHEDQPFDCLKCGKPFATKNIIEAMTGRLAGHSMFSGTGALKRLQMCADCRIVDMMAATGETSVLKI
jgi:ferredoxin